MSCVCHAFTSVHCCLVVTWRERADLLAFVRDVIVILLLSHLVWYLIVSIPLTEYVNVNVSVFVLVCISLCPF